MYALALGVPDPHRRCGLAQGDALGGAYRRTGGGEMKVAYRIVVLALLIGVLWELHMVRLSLAGDRAYVRTSVGLLFDDHAKLLQELRSR
jgi:hypothetical protein